MDPNLAPLAVTEASDGEPPIPTTVRLGVTGHRALGDEEKLRASVREVLAMLDRLLAHTPHFFVAVSPLAEGADRLVASEILVWPGGAGGSAPALEVPLPLDEQEYRQDFATPESQGEFAALLAKARSVQTLPQAQSRNAAYEQVGRYVVHNCDVLVAIWNGKSAPGQGGTAEIVEYARRVDRTLFWIHSESGKVVEERHDDRTLEALAYLDAYNTEHLDARELGDAVEALHRSLIEKATAAGFEPSLAAETLDPARGDLLPQFIRAGELAQHYHDLHERAGSAVYTLAALAVATVTIQTLFLPHLPQLLWLEVVAMASVLALLGASHLGDWHRKWIDYRFLAERLRAAIFLYVAGIDCKPLRPPPPPSLSHRPGEWMVTAFAWIWGKRPTARCGREVPFEPLKRFLLEAWIRDQANWFARKGARHRRKQERLARAGEVLFGLTLIAAAIHATGVAEAALPETLEAPGALAFLAIVLPAVGAALAGLRVHREYLRNAERYAHMVRVLSSIGDQIERAPDLRALASLLEEANDVMLRENQDWRVVFLFQRLQAV